MAPLLEDSDLLSMSTHDNYELFDDKNAFSPLHEGPIAAVPRPNGVSFDKFDTVYDVMGLDEYTPEELKASWFDHDDMIRMKDTARSDAKLLDSGLLVLGDKGADVVQSSSSSNSSKGISFRGLESRTRKGAMRKRQSRINAWNAVFCEIDFQNQDDFIDEDAIADAYFLYSEASAMTARVTAKRDAIEAKNIYMKSKKARAFWKQFLKNDF
jgi:hypothetical protein